MPYVSCPSCDLRLARRDAYELDSCPRCLAAGKHVRLDAHLGSAKPHGHLLEPRGGATAISPDAARNSERPASVPGS